MICSRCGVHFCYLCSAGLSSSKPYPHSSYPASTCYLRLWDLEEGDNDNDTVRFAGLPGREIALAAAEWLEIEPRNDE
jgi:E3 ubiquitin-protein ligase RNF14